VKKKVGRLLLFSLISLFPVCNANADVIVDAAATFVGQQTSKQKQQINKDVIGSVDLVIDADVGPGTLHLYVEGSSTPSISASDVIAGVNADAGTVVDKNGRGRIQLSEIAYGVDLNNFTVSLGVQDLTAFADATAVSNDETSQFLAGGLVNNPSIAFPDYTPSLVLNHGVEGGVNITALIANAYGLGDNPNVNYSELFRFGRDKSTGLNKGVFSLAELRIPGETEVAMGAWSRTSELPRHLAGGNKSSALGLYANLDGSLSDATQWSVRTGWNSAKATDEVVSHASLAVEHAYRDGHVIALGVAWNGLSSDYKSTFANAANPIIAELYYRWQINEYVALSPDVQYWHNANNLSTTTGGVAGGAGWVYGLRLQIGGSQRW